MTPDRKEHWTGKVFRLGSAGALLLSQVGCLPRKEKNPDASPPATTSSETTPFITPPVSLEPMIAETPPSIATPVSTEVASSPIWSAPTLEQMLVEGRGGALDPEIAIYKFEQVIPNGLARIGIEGAVVNFSDNGLAGDAYHWAPLTVNSEGLVIWAYSPAVGQLEWPVELDFVFDAEGKPVYSLHTQGLEYKTIPDSKGAVLVWGGMLDGEYGKYLAILAKDPITLPDGRQVYASYWDRTTQFWPPTPSLAEITLPQEFLAQVQEHGFHYEIVDGKAMVLTELRDFQHPVDGVERVALGVESAEYVLPLLSGEEVRIPREAGKPAVLNGALVMKNTNGEVTHLYAMVDGRAEEKAGWVSLAELAETMSNRLDGYGVTLDTSKIPETYQEVWEGAARALSTNWDETAFAAWSPRLSRVVYVTGAGEIVGMVNAGVNKIEQLPEGVVWMMGDGNVFVFSTRPQETQFFRRVQLAKKEGAETVWEFEGEDGHRVFAGAARALLYNDWSVQSGQPLPAGQEKYEPLWWIEGEGAKYFAPGEAGKRGVIINGKRVEISGPIFVIPGKTAEKDGRIFEGEEIIIGQGFVVLPVGWAGDGNRDSERNTAAAFFVGLQMLHARIVSLIKKENVGFGMVIGEGLYTVRPSPDLQYSRWTVKQ